MARQTQSERSTAYRLPVSRQAAMLVLASYAAGVVLNLHHLAWWSLPLAGGVCLWRARAAWRSYQLPSRVLRVALVLGLTIAVLASFRTLNGLAAGSTLMTAMGAAKLIEARSRRDWYISLATATILLLAACLDAQSLWRLPLYALHLWLLATTLEALGSDSSAAALLPTLRRAGRSLLLAVPVAILLFLFFPRLPGAFWALPEGGAATTGLGDEMSPGSISELTIADDIAMRVRFDGPMPPPEQRYFRGPVLHDFDGYTWRRREGMFIPQPPLQYTGQRISYRVTLEPVAYDVLPALEMPELPTHDYRQRLRLSFDYQLTGPRSSGVERDYQLVSYPEYRNPGTLSVLGRRIDTRLPPDRNRRTLELARRMRAEAAGDRDFVQAVLRYFRDGGFVYTLTPPLLDYDSVDDFLFNTRRGFCGHYASAFVTMMRAAGIPARVVTGYLGGDWNPIGEYLLVRQSYAHAWAEVWLDGNGWTRFDPTAVVAPERLQRGALDLLPGIERSTAQSLRTVPILNDLLQGIDAMNAWWHDRVVEYDFRQQLALLASLGLEGRQWSALVWLLGAGGSLWMAWLVWQLRDRMVRPRPDGLRRQWRRFERRLARHGIARAPHEGPTSFATRAAQLLPAHAAGISAFARQYARLRYGQPAPAEALLQLRRALAELTLR